MRRQGKRHVVPGTLLLLGGWLWATQVRMPGVCGPKVALPAALDRAASGPDYLQVVAFSPDGQWLALGGGSGLSLWQVGTWRKEATLLRSPCSDVGFARCGLLAAALGSMILVCRPDSGETAGILNLPDEYGGRPSDIAISPDGQWVAAGWHRKVLLYAVRSGRLRGRPRARELPAMPYSGESVAFSPDGRYLAASGNELVLWRLPDFAPMAGPPTGQEASFRMAVSADGALLAAPVNRAVRIWDVGTGKVVRTLDGSAGWPMACAFSPDGRILAMACCAGRKEDDPEEFSVVKLFGVRAGKELAALGRPSRGFLSVGFSPDGRWLAATDEDMARVWRVSDALAGRLVGGRRLRAGETPAIPAGR